LDGDPGAEPAELARHYGLAAGLAGPEAAIAAYRTAARAAAGAHDHEQAAAHTQSVLSLLSESDLGERSAALLELGEQELLCADMARARRSFLDAASVARANGDAETFARAALGFAGGDIGFGWETGTVDTESVELLREGLRELGDEAPRLALRIVFRLAYLLVITDDEEEKGALVRRAEELASRLDDPEARVLARFTGLVAQFAHSSDPLRVLDRFEEFIEMLDLAVECGREDLLFRVVQWVVVAHYVRGRMDECERAMEWAEEIARRLGSPRFAWEVDMNRGMRLFDYGDREGGEVLVRRAGAVVRRLRPDIHIAVETVGLLVAEWTFDGEPTVSRLVYEAWDRMISRGITSAFIALAASIEGDIEIARRLMWDLLGDDLRRLRRPDGYIPLVLWALAFTATRIGDREAGARLRPLFEPMRGRLVGPVPTVGYGHPPEWYIGRLELLADRPDAAIKELRRAIDRVDACKIVWASAMVRVDLARALHRRGDPEQAEAVLSEAESLATRYGIGWATASAAEARAEIEGREPVMRTPAVGRLRPVRAIAARRGRQALAAMVRNLDDAELERRFAEPRRQRALVKALARSFQPAGANGFNGVIAYELEPYAIEPPADAPWRWAIEIDSDAGHARLLEPAPLDASVTIHVGLAEWLRVMAGLEDALTAMVAGRSSVEGDVVVAVRQEAMFGAG